MGVARPCSYTALGFSIDSEEARSAMCLCTGEDFPNCASLIDFLHARTTRRYALHIQIRIIKVHADETCSLNCRSHGVAPQILQQSIFMIYKADEY